MVKTSAMVSTYATSAVSEESSGNAAEGKQEFLKALNDPAFLHDFEKHLIGEFSAENLRMFIESRKWEEIYFDATDSQRRARAKKIIETFVHVNSIFEVNLPDDARTEIERKFANMNDHLPQTLFARSQLEVIGMMYDGYR